MDGKTQSEYAFQQQGNVFEQHAKDLSNKTKVNHLTVPLFV